MWFDSNAVEMTTAEHALTKFSEHAFSFSVLNEVNTLSKQFDRNYSFCKREFT